MTFDRRAAGIAALALCAVGDAASGQNAPRTIPGLVIASPTPAAAATPVPTPSMPRIVLPPRVVTPRAARAVAPRAMPTSTPTPTPAPAPVIEPTTVPVAAPTPTPLPTAPVAQAPIAVSPPAVAPVPQAPGGWPWLPAVAAILASGVAGWLILRRRTVAEPRETLETDSAVPAPPPPRARVTIALRPLRAGLNMLSATAECEVTLVNTGDAAARDCRLRVTMLSAHAGQEVDLAQIRAQPIARPAVPPFILTPGEERRIRAVAALPRDAIRSMTAGGRAMFVPIVAVDLTYAAADDITGQTAQAFAIGIERPDAAKLAPFWLDGPARMHDVVAARAQGAGVVR